jgi:hypothetical protein
MVETEGDHHSPCFIDCRVAFKAEFSVRRILDDRHLEAGGDLGQRTAAIHLPAAVPAFRSSEDADKQDRISALGTRTGKGHGDVRLRIDCNVDALAGFALAAAGVAVTSQAARGRPV